MVNIILDKILFINNDVITTLKTFLEKFAKNVLTMVQGEMWFSELSRF